MLDLMKSNIYQGEETIIIVGSCLENVQPLAFSQLEKLNNKIFSLCLEETHLNMALSKIIGFVRTKMIKKIIFASVDKSPHCIQLHYIQDELKKCGFDIETKNYVAINDKLEEISQNTLSISKSLYELNKISSKKLN